MIIHFLSGSDNGSSGSEYIYTSPMLSNVKVYQITDIYTLGCKTGVGVTDLDPSWSNSVVSGYARLG